MLLLPADLAVQRLECVVVGGLMVVGWYVLTTGVVFSKGSVQQEGNQLCGGCTREELCAANEAHEFPDVAAYMGIRWAY